jgi:hypothetical protein
LESKEQRFFYYIHPIPGLFDMDKEPEKSWIQRIMVQGMLQAGREPGREGNSKNFL